MQKSQLFERFLQIDSPCRFLVAVSHESPRIRRLKLCRNPA